MPEVGKKLGKIVGKKVGMTRFFDDKGNVVVCTVISAEKNVITQVKTPEKDGYHAIQLATEVVSEPKKKNVSKALLGHFAKAKVEPRRTLFESRVENAADYQVGQEVGLEIFKDVSYIDISGVSKGKGFQGTMKRYNFGGGRASHGNSRYHRGGGSTGMRSTPGRVLPLRKKAGHMGSDNMTTQCLKVVKVDLDNQCILVEGAVPGSKGSTVMFKQSKKKK